MRLIRGLFRLIGGTIKWTLIIGATLIVVGVIAGVLLLGRSVSNANKDAGKVAAKMSRLSIGATEAQAKSLLGGPNSTDMESIDGEASTYWYYGEMSTKGTWQLVFEGGRLTDKNEYN